jgi:hypothetical protein
MDKNTRYISYAFGKFSEAYYQLAIGAGDIKPRLLAASDKFWAVDPEMLPQEIKKHFIWIRNQLMRFPAIRDEGKVKATIHRIHRSTCVEIAKRVVLVYSLLESELSIRRTKYNSMPLE